MGDANQRKTFIYKINEEVRTIEEITAEQVVGKELLGTARGQDVGHCLYLGARYCKTTDDFLRAVRYYVVAESKHRQCAVEIEFYR